MKTPPKKSTLMSRARAALASLAAALFAAFTASAATMTQLVNGPSDIRVAPLIEASWAQGAVGGSPCYNSKTPENCLCGCVATAAGQIMRKWQYPAAAAVKVTNTLSVNGTEQSCTMLGGPEGVSYDWANMPFKPANETSLTDAQRNAIGTLLYDIGVAAKMKYTTSSSATYTAIMFDQFTETFGYSNAAIVGNVSGTGLTLEQFTQAVLPSLDAGMPVMVGIGGANTSHSVICDGYGYQDGDLYIHINMGWSNDSDDPTTKFNNTWYKFPTAVLNTSTKEYISGNGVSLWPSGEQSYLNPAVYNISPTMPEGASIISGRIFSDATDSVALQGATVVALNTSGAPVYTATSDAKGIYALILPAGTYTLRAMASDQTKGARRLVTVTATAGTRSGATATGVVIGNRHGIDFHLTEDGSAVLAAGLASTPIALAHRWSFNGDLKDSVGTAEAQPVRSWYESNSAHVTVGDGVEPVFDGNAVKLGAENYTTSGKATSLNLGTGLVTTNDVTLEIWATRRSIQNNARMFDWGNGGLGTDPSQYVCLPWYAWGKEQTLIWNQKGGNSAVIANCFENSKKYHVVLTVRQDGTSSVFNLVRRVASDISDVKRLDPAQTCENWTLSNVVGGRFYLGHSQWSGESGSDANATYDEVRIWNGVVEDELLAVNAAMGPDTVALKYGADGKACFDIPAGATLPINANTIGNNYTLAGSVTFGAGAKIEFDTANNPAGMSFTAEGGFTGVTADNVANYVTHTSTAAYDVTLSGNTITVTPARLAHRWSFNGNLEDSAGTATAQPIRSSTAGVTFGDSEPVFDGNAVKLGAENYATSGKATSLNLGTGLVSTNDVTIEMWATRRSTIQSGARLFDWGNGGYDGFKPTQYVCMPWYNSIQNNSIVWVSGVGSSSAAYTDCFTSVGERYHIAFTIWKDGTTSKFHFVRRDASLAKKEYSDLPLTTLLSDVVPNWRLYLGHSQWVGVGGGDERGKDANATYDEVRIWNGVVPDALLALNADMGPDTMALKYDANGIASVVVPDGKTLHVNENTVGDYTLAGSVTLDGSARIEFNFDTALHPNGMSFTAEGGFTGITAANVADYVTVPEGYDVTLSGNTISVAPATATSWTGEAGDGNWNNAANWTKGVPTAGKDATILASATTMPLTVPADAAYASFTVAGGALAANTDWSGLAQKPVISGTVDLNGHDLMMPSVGITIAQSGAAFSNSAAATNEVRFLANDATVAATEATYIDGVAYLTTAANAKIAIVHSSGDSSGTLNVGAANNHTAFRAESGTVSMSANGNVGMTSGGVGYLDVAGGTVDFCTANSRGISLGGANARAIVNISGGKLRANWIDAGHNDVTECTIVQTGGEVETGINNNGNLWLGRHGRGKATYTLSNGSINVTKGTLDVGNYGTATFTQDGGTVTVAASNLRIGAFGNSTGTYAMSDGSLYVTAGQLDVGADGTGVFTQDGGTVTIAASDLYVGRNSGSTGTYTLNGGKITPKYWQWVGNIGTGTFIQNGGTNHVWGSNNNVLAISGRGGSGTYVMNGGLLEVQSYIRVGGWHNPGTGVLEVNGGTIITPSIDRTQAQGSSTVKLNGGTIKTSANGNILKSIGNVVFGGNATTIDTDGYDTSITGCGYDTIGGGSLVKAGAGTLTVDAMPPVSALVVSNGTFALSAAADNSKSFAALAHRWSFNGDLADSVGGCTATTIGSKTDVNYVNDNTAVQTGSDQAATYATSLNLGKALSAGEAVTVEIWAKRNSLNNAMRLFDWGLSNTDYICMSWNDNANVWVKTGNADRSGTPAGLVSGCFANDVNYHLGVTFTANSDGTTTIRVVRHNLDDSSEEAKMLTTTFPSCDLLEIIAGNLYLGHSQYSGESGNDATAVYDEVRVWKGILSDDALALSAQKGADATTADIAAIVAKNAEAGTVSRALDIESGATVNLGGFALTQPVIAGAGTVQSGALTVTEKIRVNAGEKLTFSGVSLDLTGTTLEVADPENITGSFVFAESDTAITGKPSYDVKGWKVKRSADGKTLTLAKIKGVMIIAK